MVKILIVFLFSLSICSNSFSYVDKGNLNIGVNESNKVIYRSYIKYLNFIQNSLSDLSFNNNLNNTPINEETVASLAIFFQYILIELNKLNINFNDEQLKGLRKNIDENYESFKALSFVKTNSSYKVIDPFNYKEIELCSGTQATFHLLTLNFYLNRNDKYSDDLLSAVGKEITQITISILRSDNLKPNSNQMKYEYFENQPSKDLLKPLVDKISIIAKNRK